MKSFVLRIPINALEAKIFETISLPSGLESWFLRQADFRGIHGSCGRDEKIRVNDHYTWKWYGYPDYIGEGRVLENNGCDKLVFTFTGNCIVTITIGIEKGESMLTLTQTEIPDASNPEDDLYIQCQKGWTFYLTNLKSVLENGYDLRNKRDDLEKVITA